MTYLYLYEEQSENIRTFHVPVFYVHLHVPTNTITELKLYIIFSLFSLEVYIHEGLSR